MIQTSSPWLHQLDNLRPIATVSTNLACDTVIIGGGIAGIATAFFALKYTQKKVTLLEAYKVAHGATGHNAGQIVSYFEHPFARLVEHYGQVLAARAQEEIFYAWDLLDEIYQESQATAPLAKFTGYAGCSSISQLIDHLENIQAEREAGLDIEGVLIAGLPYITQKIPEKYHNLYARVDHKEIMRLLETSDHRYIGALASRKGCVNSALLCEEIVRYLLKKYPDRFEIFEHSPVHSLTLGTESALITVGEYDISAQKVILCTNGFSNFSITSDKQTDIDTRFHQAILGKIGYMAAYTEKSDRPPVAISYFSHSQNILSASYDRSRSLDAQDPYFYLTRRPFKHTTEGHINLVCVGGPESQDEPLPTYNARQHVYPEEARKTITAFMQKTFAPFPNHTPDYSFLWHGLMGYTKSGLRCVGPDPKNPVLLYNIGCNGVGILSSIYGGKRISNFLLHKKLEPSIFDPLYLIR